MKLWLDGVRPAPEGWVWVRRAEAAEMWLALGPIEDLSLDHDLGAVKTGYDLLTVMQRRNLWPTRSITVHSMNPVGKANMEAFIEKYAPEHLKKGGAK